MKAVLGEGVSIDVGRLVETRMLLQANSGGGKSYAIRKLLEVSYGAAQQIVIDVEGEFHSLREKYDYVLAGQKGGDCPADLKSAAMLARRLLELNVSAIIDIYELGTQRQRFVKLFLQSLMEAPRDLWHPVLLVIDEAHMFCPEKDKAESAHAVVDLMTRGRKRGFAGVLATQRISKLAKDAAAECNNKLIGRCGLDIDMRRAADELGFNHTSDRLLLRDLKPGEFYAFGPALCDSITKVKIGAVKTTHPKAGDRAMPPTPPRERVKRVLAQLANLPHEAEEEAKTVAELQQEVRKLKSELRKAETAKPPTKTETIRELTPLIDQRTLARVLKHAEKMDAIRDKLAQSQQVVVAETGNLVSFMKAQLKKIESAVVDTLPPRLRADAVQMHMQQRPKIGAPPAIGAQKHPPMGQNRLKLDEKGLDGPAKRVLGALAWFEAIGVREPSTTAVAYMSKYSGENGAFNNVRGRLRSMGLVLYPNSGTMSLSLEGREQAPEIDVPATGEALREEVLQRLDGPQQRVLKPLIGTYPNPAMISELAEASGYGGLNGAFNNVRGRLRTLGLITYPGHGMARAADILFPD